MPISKVEWVEIDKLTANDYNPNVVFNNELKLLKVSLLQSGWIQPILVTQNYVIIDGFHRASIVKTDKDVNALTGGLVPVVVMQLSEAERMCLTIRINRAKGSHIAIKMSEIIHSLVDDYGMTIKELCKELGATKDEIEVLMMDNVFKSLDTENKVFSKAWYPNVK